MALKLIAFDLDGTLTQHKSLLGEKNRNVLDCLSKTYRLLMVGAGTCERIFHQMGEYPIDIIGNYGMQYAEYDQETSSLKLMRSEQEPVDRDEILRRASQIRERFGLQDFTGDTMEFHPTGALTFPVLGTAAKIADKLSYDPDRSKRGAMYPYVREVFSDYNVMIGGSSSFDIVPARYGKCNALRRYLQEHGFTEDEVLYCGDDYGEGGNDHDIYAAGIPFLCVDNYEALGELLKQRLNQEENTHESH